MLIQLLWPIFLTLLLVITLFSERKLIAATTITLLYGVGYAAWGFIRVRGVPYESVAAVDMTKIWTGLTMVVIGIILYVVWRFKDLRKRMPPR